MAMRILRANTDGADVFNGTSTPELIYGWDPNVPSALLRIDAIRIASSLSQPLFVTAPKNDKSSLFIVEKTGLIKIMDLATGQIGATPFLNVASQIATDGEQGLLGLAFHPDFAQNGKVYVYMSTADGDVELRQYQTSASNALDPFSERLVLRIDFSSATNHRGGWIGFGPDGYLYAAVGESASSANAQNPSNLLGKMLRMDMNGGDAYPADPDRNYAIPPDNPTHFDGIDGTFDRSAVYAIGLRNPWRDSFDASGNFFIADVGANSIEEINLARPGANYGWGRGTGQDDGPISPPDPRYTNPIYSYEHGSLGGSITGGYVYRGPNEGLQGQYVFGDFVRGTILTLTQEGGTWNATDRTAQISTDAGTIDNISSFGEDASGNLYVVDIDGDIYRLNPVGSAVDVGDHLAGNGGANIIFGGDGNDSIYGGADADRLDGGSGNDRLSGGAGSDLLVGRAGNDLLVGGNGPDRLFGGSDDDILLGRASNDRLYGGVGNDHAYGGHGNDTIYGGAGGDWLYGSSGTEKLYGGSGRDTFVFNNKSPDYIQDYSTRDDTIWLDNASFKGLSRAATEANPTRLKHKAFWAGEAAHDGSDHIIYNKTTGALYYDPDGTGAVPQAQFAQLKPNLHMTYKEFFVI